MRKSYMMLFALVLSVLGATTAVGQKIYMSEVDASMFKAWDGCGADAKEVANPDPIDITDENPEGTPFACQNNLYKEVGDWTCIFGNPAAYYLWYADLAGSQKIYFKGTPGFKFWVQFNREAPLPEGSENYDPHGGAMAQTELTIGDDGTASYDCSGLPFLHLNCIKTKGSGIKGRLTSILIEGTMRPVTGFLPLVWNGDAEGDDVSSFPVSYDGPNNGGTANDKPEIVAGQGVNGSRCFKVTSFPDPTEVWHTQFYVYADEVMPKGSKWILKMSVKADHDTKITTSAQAAPRTWKGGMGISEFAVGTEWKDFTWSGEIGVDDFQSIAFDLNNGDERNANDDGWLPGNGNCNFYFDNIEFGYDLGSANPASEISAAYGADVIEINMGGKTNIKDLVAAADGKKVIFPNDCATVTWNGKPANPISIEGRPNGNLYVFLLDIDGDDDPKLFDDENAVVKVAFTNPTDPALRLLFTEGKWEGQPVPDFSGMVCTYNGELGAGDYQSYIWGPAELLSAEPENGSFNLPNDQSEFTVTFNQNIEVATVAATLGLKEKLTASADGEYAKVITLKRTGTSALNGEMKLYIDHAVTDRGYDLDDPIILDYSFGPVTSDENDQPAVIYQSNFSQDGDDANGAGWMVNADAGGLQVAASGSGCRILHGQGAFVDDLVYIAQRSTPGNGVALYGIDEEHKLTLEAKTYHFTLGACRHDRTDVALLVQVLPESAVNTEDGSLLDEDAVLAQDRQEITPEKTSKQAIRFDLAVAIPEAGNYVIRLVPSKTNGSYSGYEDAVCFGDVKVEYLPSTMGLLEMKALEAALETAKAALDTNSDERYAGTAYTTLDNLVKEYDGKTMTAPSAYAKATADLTAATTALNDHVTLVKEYDALPGKAFDIYEANKDKKFNVTEYFATLKAAVQKYCTLGIEEVVNEETGEVTTQEVMESFKLLYDDAELNAAKAELNDVITLSGGWLTDEKSQNVWGHITTGYAALHERLRRGVELLKSIGAEDAYEIAAADAELGDNDEIAEAIVQRASLILVGDLAGEKKLFADVTIDDNGEEVGPSYDLSVFMKNPNIYGPANSTETPGWTSVKGNCFAWSSWDGATNHSANTPYPEDCQIHAGWHPNGGAITEQTIENLPAGIYTIKIQCSDNNSPVSEGTCAFVKTSSTPVVEEGEDLDPDVHYAGYITASGDIEGIEVVDGVLTVGFNFGPGSQAFLNDVEIWMTKGLDGHDYSADYQVIAAGVETAKTAKVRAIELYDLNGRRVSSARKGLVIVKKLMSDGTVKTEKVVK